MDSQTTGGLKKPTIFVVDDQPYYLAMVEKAIGDFCRLIPFGDGEHALAALPGLSPDLILLDVEMPGIGGYETCQRIKTNGTTVDIPIIFLSGHNEIEDRLKGYESGGQDYLAKPFNSQELRAKVLHLLGQSKYRDELKSIVNSVSSTSMLVMTSMSEVGVLLDSLRRFNVCMTCADLAREVIAGAANYDLQAVVHVRIPDDVVTMSWNGVVSPLEESVIDRMCQLGERIVEFKTRMSVNYEHVSLLINNMPVSNTELCGRLRDHLAMLIEGANVRAQGIIAMNQTRLRCTIEDAVAGISEALSVLEADQKRHRLNLNAAVNTLRDSIESAVHDLILSDAQETYMLETLHHGVEEIIRLHVDEPGFQNKLGEIIHNLRGALVCSQPLVEK